METKNLLKKRRKIGIVLFIVGLLTTLIFLSSCNSTVESKKELLNGMTKEDSICKHIEDNMRIDAIQNFQEHLIRYEEIYDDSIIRIKTIEKFNKKTVEWYEDEMKKLEESLLIK